MYLRSDQNGSLHASFLWMCIMSFCKFIQQK
uniref:Uncharacterized protein n=1 Tax=Setaria italica TaxID=4555 RepID=K3XUP3_SETIT